MDASDEIKARISIDELVGRYVELKRSGASYKGLCPFHQERTPSFYVSPSRGTYHCFGCGKGGDIFQFLIDLEHLTFREALERLAEQAGIQLERQDPNKPSLRKQLYAANEVALRYFREALESGAGKRAWAYLEGRTFDRAAADLFELGYAPDGRDGLVQYLRRQGIENRIMVGAGLAHQDEGDASPRDRFRGRLMFPIRDQSGRVTGFGGRIMGEGQPKYLNSPQTEIFDKSSVLYGVHLAAEAIRKEGRSVLVEGYLDALRAHRAGFGWTVASLGTAITVPQLTALSRLSERVVIALDPDPAGQSAAARAAVRVLAEVLQGRDRAQATRTNVDLRVARLPEGLGDPDELIRDHPERWVEIIDAAIPAFDFYFERTLASLDRSKDTWAQEAIDELLPLIQQFSMTAAWQAQQIERLARATGVDVRVLLATLPAARPRGGRRVAERKGDERGSEVVSSTTSRALTSDPVLKAEEELLALLLKLIVVPNTAVERLTNWTPQRAEDRAILAALLGWAAEGGYDYEILRERFPAEAREYADELRGRDVPLPDDGHLSIAIEFYLARLRRLRLHVELTGIQSTLKEIEPSDAGEATEALMRVTAAQREMDELLDRLSKNMLKAVGGGPD